MEHDEVGRRRKNVNFEVSNFLAYWNCMCATKIANEMSRQIQINFNQNFMWPLGLDLRKINIRLWGEGGRGSGKKLKRVVLQFPLGEFACGTRPKGVLVV